MSGVIGLLDAAAHKGTSGVFRVAMMESSGSLYLSGRLTPFIASNPDLQLELVTSSFAVSVTRREANIFFKFFLSSMEGGFTASKLAISVFFFMRPTSISLGMADRRQGKT